MGHSTMLISLSLVTLLSGLSIAAYQLWSAEHARRDQHSALAARFGGKPYRAARLPEPPIRDEPRDVPATLQADVMAPPPPQAEAPKRSTRAPRRKPKPDLSQNA